MPMLLVYLVAGIVIAGVLVWGLLQLPIDYTFKNIARVAVIVVLVIWIVWVLVNMVHVVLPPGAMR